MGEAKNRGDRAQRRMEAKMKFIAYSRRSLRLARECPIQRTPGGVATIMVTGLEPKKQKILESRNVGIPEKEKM